MILLDTNVLIYAITPSDPRHPACKTLLSRAAEHPNDHALTWINLFEYLRVVTHPRILPEPLTFDAALGNVREMSSRIPLLHPGPRHLDYVTRVAKDLAPVKGDRVFDCRIAAILRENGGSRILSYDTRFRRVQGLEVVLPDAA